MPKVSKTIQEINFNQYNISIGKPEYLFCNTKYDINCAIRISSGRETTIKDISETANIWAKIKNHYYNLK